MSFLDKLPPVIRKNLPPVLLCAAVSAVLWPVLRNGFVDWDDGQYVTLNAALRGSWADALAFSPGYYHPLTTLTYKLEFYFFGLAPLPYHFTSLVLHLLVCVSFFHLFGLLGSGVPAAFTGALLFGIHPAHVEPVAWISGRKELLWGVFACWTLICYLRFLDTGLKKFLVCSLSAFALAVLSKPTAAVVPFALLLIDHCRNRAFGRRILMEKAPYAIIALLSFLLSYVPSGFLLRRGPGTFDVINTPLRAGQSVLFYLGKLAAPFNLAALYPGLEPPVNQAGCLLLILCAGLAAAWGWRHALRAGLLRGASDGACRAEGAPGAACAAPGNKTVFGFGFFIITLLPAMLISPPADRYGYVPSAGLFFLYGELIAMLYAAGGGIRPFGGRAGLCRLPASALATGIIAVVAAQIVFFSLASYSRAQVWRDSMTLWSDVLGKYPLEHTAYYGRGNAYYAAGQFAAALADFTRCLELEPGYWKAFSNRGRTFAEMKEYDKAIADYGAGISINPASAQLFLNRGNAYLLKKEYARALADYDRALAIAPDFFPAAENRRVVLEDIARKRPVKPQ